MREIDKVYNFSLFFFFIVSHRLILMEEGDLKYTTINLYLLISGISGISGVSGIKPHLKLTTQVAMKVQRQFAGKLFQTFVRRAKKKKEKEKKTTHNYIYIYIYIYIYVLYSATTALITRLRALYLNNALVRRRARAL